MNKLIDLTVYPVKDVLSALLKDKTTKQNIIFATDAYKEYGFGIDEKTRMTKTILLKLDQNLIQPRVMKSMDEQALRTKRRQRFLLPHGSATR